ncbi:hypothetical protein FLL45_13940 [Aliikangiella marina]|uniref:Uncharacterized protein n=1 Tax=Aliikangiella marina TaxID=1712262 RepID=A0A545T9S2_9GAMM|nr:hypothetical protein [Aliikangiella marina]TQV73959.1 hypothetical protein FLL45_13940 [Aliikangiella marina]
MGKKVINLIAINAVTYLILSITNISANPQENMVSVYAKACFKKLEIKPRDLPKYLDCKDGDRIDSFENGIKTSKSSCDKNKPGDCVYPQSCDMKDWLHGKCYGNTYLTVNDKVGANEDVTMALMCRHVEENTNHSKRFDDIAMILHNRKNGETCWFQTLPGNGKAINGSKVPRPTNLGSLRFWLSPKDTKDINCIECHDSGPFIVSPWLAQAKSAEKLKDTKAIGKKVSKYLNSTAPFDDWPSPQFITVGASHLSKKKDSCTNCHNIGTIAKKEWPSYRAEFRGTCSMFIDRSHSEDNRIFDVAKNRFEHFMPPVSFSKAFDGKYSESEWHTNVGEHVEALKRCCNKFTRNKNYQDPTGECRLE